MNDIARDRDDYQFGFSDDHREAMYDSAAREKKARKMIAVLSDHFGGDMKEKRVLDIGCSTGIISNSILSYFGHVTGIDIDESAVKYAMDNVKSDKVEFSVQDAMDLGFDDGSFDIVICAHVYEHVPDSGRLMSEVRRVLKPGGVCYFAAGNKYNVIEAHYKLPFLSYLPKRLADMYLRLTGKGTSYYEKHLSLWGLKRLAGRFKITDYTKTIICEPEKFDADDMIRPGSIKHKVLCAFINVFYWFCPTYIWVIKKTEDD